MGVRFIIMTGMCLFIASACATTPSSPEEICTAEWISARSDKAMKEFDREVRPMMRTLRRAGDNLSRNKNLGSFQMLSVMRALNKMVGKFENSRALKDLKLVGDTCNDPSLTQKALTGFMRDQGAPDELIRFLDNIDSFKSLNTVPEK